VTIHIVLPVHDRIEITRQFVTALNTQHYSDWSLLLVDDGCTDGTVEMVRARIDTARLQVLKGDGTLWWAGALQLAFRHLRAASLGKDDQVLLINDDTEFEPDFLGIGAELLRQNPLACIQALGIDRTTGRKAGGVVADLRRLEFRAAAGGESPNCLATRGLLMAASIFLASGGFRPRWLPHYLSDYEFTMRLHRQGVQLLCLDQFRLQYDAATTGTDGFAVGGIRSFWSSAFTNRAKLNPKHWSAFALLACPPGAVPLHLLRIWARFGRSLWTAARSGGWA
jgi:GT2 family glycosyltransferase